MTPRIRIIGPADALNILTALGYGSAIRAWEMPRGDSVLAVYVDSYDHAWTLACDVGGILPPPQWDTVGGVGIAYWPCIPYHDDDDDAGE